MSNHQTIYLIAILALLTTLSYSWSPEAEKDKVSVLDGYYDQKTAPFQLFSGYLQIQKEPLINIHYVFVTSMDNETLSNDVVLWLNGGPGCSSMMGWAQEIGPKMLNSGSKTFSSNWNTYAWNKKTNLLFFESPAGVGFSINNDKNYTYTQNRTAAENVQVLNYWYDKFPQFKRNNFWIAGQSYCGMYIPNFASALIENGKVKFKGIMIGNGVMVTEKYWRRRARNTFYSKHYFYGTEIDKMINYCQYDDNDLNNPSCIKGNQLADESVVNVNPYATIGVCYNKTEAKIGRKRFYYTPFFQQNNPIITEQNSGNYVPCTDDFGMISFFNNDIIKTQLHVNKQIKWQTCNQTIGRIYNKDQKSVGIFQKLKQNKLKILLYTGNTDAVVSYVETMQYINQLKWKQISLKQPFINDQQWLMGWWIEYDGLTLSIINGAGHMVPSDKPHAAFEMFTNFTSRK